MSKSGFTITELVIVIVIIGAISAIAVTRLSGFSTDSKYNAANYGFKNIASAMDLYHADNKAYPANAPIATLPPEMVGYLHPSAFTKPSPIGRAWDWNGQGSGILAHGNNISIHTTPAEDRAEMERRFDDGDPDTGTYRKQNKYLVWPMER